MFKIDLHTHSTASPDGGISATQYSKALETGLLDAIAITDHNSIEFAAHMQSILGKNIIVGEEIMTTQGEIIGLYLTDLVPAGLSPAVAVKHIKDQGGIVYIPHPFETVRSGLPAGVLEEIMDQIDLFEVYNGRAFVQNRSANSVIWAKLNHKITVASSDAHGYRGLGGTYTSIASFPTRETLTNLMDKGIPRISRPTMRGLLYPKYHRLRKKLGTK